MSGVETACVYWVSDPCGSAKCSNCGHDRAAHRARSPLPVQMQEVVNSGELVERLRARKEMRYDGPSQDHGWYDDALCQEAAARILAIEAERDSVLERKNQAANNAKSQRFDDITDKASGEVLEYIVAQEDMLDTVRAWAAHYRHAATAAEAKLATCRELYADDCDQFRATITDLSQNLERVEEAQRALEAIERIIRTNIVEDGKPHARMLIDGEWHEGTVVDTTYRLLRGLSSSAAAALSSEPGESKL